MNCRIAYLTGLNLLFQFVTTSKLVCYFASWSQYRDGPARFLPDNVDPNLCTHLIFAFAVIYGNELMASDWDDDELYKSFNALKSRNTKLKTLLSLRGQGPDAADRFSQMMSSFSTRQQFIQSSIRLLRMYNFDGLDLAWEGNTSLGGPPGNKRSFTLLCKELVEAYEAESRANGYQRLMISAAVAAKRNVIFLSYDVPQISQYLDFISVMTFDFHESQEGLTNHHSPLYSGEHQTGKSLHYNIHSAMLYWQEQGAPPEKLLMGFPTFGRSFLLTSTDGGVGAPASDFAAPGPYTQEMGLWSHYEICSFLQGAVVKWIDKQKVPFALKGLGWVGFDNQTSFYYKVQYLIENKLGGAVVWTLDLDDFSGEFCDQGRSPLIRYLKTQLNTGEQLLPRTEDPVTTHPVTNLTSISPTLTASTYNVTHLGHTSSPTITTHPVTCEPLTVLTSSNRFCSEKPDGFYLDLDNPSSMLQCSGGITYIARCPDTMSHSKAGQISPSRKTIILILGISSLLKSALASR